MAIHNKIKKRIKRTAIDLLGGSKDVAKRTTQAIRGAGNIAKGTVKVGEGVARRVVSTAVLIPPSFIAQVFKGPEAGRRGMKHGGLIEEGRIRQESGLSDIKKGIKQIKGRKRKPNPNRY